MSSLDEDARSTTSSCRARIPGPVGELSKIWDDERGQEAVIERGDDLDHSSLTVTAQKIQDKLSASQAWLAACHALDINPAWLDEEPPYPFCSISARQSGDSCSGESMLVIVTRFTRCETHCQCGFADPTSEIAGTVHSDLLREFGGEITEGTVLVLKTPSLLSLYGALYLCVVERSLIAVFPPVSPLPDLVEEEEVAVSFSPCAEGGGGLKASLPSHLVEQIDAYSQFPQASGGNPFAAPQSRPSDNPFGAPPQARGIPFGALQSRPSDNPFGAPQARGNLYGAPPQSKPSDSPFGAPPQAGGNLYGAPPQSKPSDSPFGAPPQAGGNLFGAPSQSGIPFHPMSGPSVVQTPVVQTPASQAPQSQLGMLLLSDRELEDGCDDWW